MRYLNYVLGVLMSIGAGVETGIGWLAGLMIYLALWNALVSACHLTRSKN